MGVRPGQDTLLLVDAREEVGSDAIRGSLGRWPHGGVIGSPRRWGALPVQTGSFLDEIDRVLP